MEFELALRGVGSVSDLELSDGQICGGTDVVAAGSNTVALHHGLLSSACPSSLIYGPASGQNCVVVQCYYIVQGCLLIACL